MNLARTREALERGLADGLHTGVQLYVSLCGEVVADVAIGEAQPGVPMTVDTVMPWMSSGKPLTAVAILSLVDRHEFDLDEPVAERWPAFAGGGKNAITPRHLLTHTAGLRHVEHGWPEADWDTIVGRVAAAAVEPDWTPGERAGYDPAVGWFVLGELLARQLHTTFDRALRDVVLDPLHLDATFCGCSSPEYHTVRDRLGLLHERSPKGLLPRDWQIDERAVTTPGPGGNVRGPIRELGRFHEALLAVLKTDREGPLDLSPATLRTMIERHRADRFDETFRHVVDFGLGVIVDSNHQGVDTVPYGFGRSCSPRTFGHGGVQSSIGFCDPERELVVAWVTNGMIGEPRHQRRNRAINDAIFEDLGFG